MIRESPLRGDYRFASTLDGIRKLRNNDGTLYMKPTSAISRKKSAYYPDIQIFLVVIPLIAGYNYYLTYSNPQFNLFLLLTFSIDTLQGYASIFFIRTTILYLDKVLPYRNGIIKRILIQTIIVLGVGLFVTSLLTELTSLIARGKMVSIQFYFEALPIISIWFFVVSGIYIALFFYNEWRSLRFKQTEFDRQLNDGLTVKWRNIDSNLHFNDIVGFTVDGDYSICHDKQGKKYYIEKSLTNLHKDLPSILFYRINRQHILHRAQISGFKRSSNGKIIALIHSEQFPGEITISRTKASEFRRWFKIQPDISSGKS